MGLVVGACAPKENVVVETKFGTITKEELYNEMLNQNGQDVVQSMVLKKTLDELVSVSEQTVNQEVERIKADLGSDEAFEGFLRENRFDNVDELKSEVKYSMMLFDYSTRDVVVLEEEIKKEYEKLSNQVTFKDFLYDDLTEAKTARSEIVDKVEVSSLETYFQEMKAKQKAMDFDKLGRGQLNKVLEEAVFSLEEGVISEPVKVDYDGVTKYHIIYIERVDKVDYEKVKAEIEKRLKAKQAIPIEEVYNELIQEASVNVKIKELKHIFEGL